MDRDDYDRGIPNIISDTSKSRALDNDTSNTTREGQITALSKSTVK